MAESGIVLDVIQYSKDIYSNSLKSITHEHSKIHSGDFYSALRSTTVLGASSWVDILLVTSTSKKVHLSFDVNNSGGLCEINLFKVHSTGSTQILQPTATLTALNRNSLSANTATLGLYQDSTGVIFVTTTQADNLTSGLYFGSTGSVSFGGGIGIANIKDEFILAQGTTYICRLYNRNTAGYARMQLFWYEST